MKIGYYGDAPSLGSGSSGGGSSGDTHVLVSEPVELTANDYLDEPTYEWTITEA